MSPARRYAVGLFLITFAVSHFLASSVNRPIEGLVEDERFRQAGGASVGWQGNRVRVTTDERGHFRLPMSFPSGRLVATKPGYRIATADDVDTPIVLRLARLPTSDNDLYKWINPHRDATKSENCANCHDEIYREWRGSAHARSANNPKFLSLYGGDNGKQPAHEKWNVQKEHPLGDGVCIKCHVPTLESYVSADLRSLDGVQKSGVHCDYCHKVSDVPTGKFGTRFGHDALEFLRPFGDDLLTFGPLNDALRKGESFAYSPVYKESRYCASCHEGTVFGVHAYGTYSEWLDSPAKAKGKQCQDCHMAPTGTMTNIAPGKGGIERDPRTLASHHTPGAQPEMLRKAVSLKMDMKNTARGRLVDIEITAANVGHRVPTGFPDRQLILVVTAKQGALLEGSRLPKSAGNWAGMPGSLFAKQLHNEHGRSPIPFWLHVDKVEDTRLFPDRPERRTFLFAPEAAGVTAQLWYRRFWHEVAVMRGWKDNDLMIVEQFAS